jgi:hypothetical protein
MLYILLNHRTLLCLYLCLAILSLYLLFLYLHLCCKFVSLLFLNLSLNTLHLNLLFNNGNLLGSLLKFNQTTLVSLTALQQIRSLLIKHTLK